MKPKLRNTPLVQSLARLEQSADKTDKYAGLPPGGLRGTIVDVDDPEDRGRVRVVFDDHNPDIPQVTGAGEWSKSRTGSDPDKSHWIDTSPAFKGKQPPGLVGKRVNIAASNGQYQYAVLQDVMYDPEMLATDKKGDLKMPDNSSMTRLPCYPSGSLPPASAENVGCVIVETGGFDGMDWLTVCLKRGGGYTWVNLMDRLHIHDSQAADSDGDSEGTVNDDTHATTGG
jgi:hypothetical protein